MLARKGIFAKPSMPQPRPSARGGRKPVKNCPAILSVAILP